MADTYEAAATAEAESKAKRKRLSDEDLRAMRKRWQHGIERDKENRSNAKQDLAFRSGEGQWDDTERKLREEAGRPTLSFNKSGAFIRQVTGDVRQNKPAIKVSPSGEGARQETAEIYAGLIRNIEQQSHAPYVYSQGADNSITCGFGYWRVITQYASDDSFEQDIRIKPIPNALSVVRDPDAIELDRSDAKWWFVYSNMAIDDFKAEYPDARVVDFEKSEQDEFTTYDGWFTKDTVRIAEYWCKKPVTKTLAQLEDGRVICLDDYKDDKAKLDEALAGTPIKAERLVKTHKIVQHIVSGAEELEDPKEWAGSYIPFVEVIGEEIWVDEKCVKKGLIRDAKDAMRAYNYTRSSSIEVVALQPKAPYKVSTAMIDGYEKIWQNANTNVPYLPFHADPNMPGKFPEREQPPVPATGLMAEAEMANRDIQATIGIFDPQLGAKSNETSGKAIIAREQQGDTGTFVWIDNLGLAIEYTGKILIDLMPKIYDTRRVLRVLDDDGKEQQIVVNHLVRAPDGKEKIQHDPELVDQKSGAKGFYDITAGKYDVVVQPGPSFASKREQAAEGIKETMQYVGPVGALLLAARLAKTQDWHQADEVSDDLEKLLPPELQKPKMGADGQPIQPPPPPPPPEAVKAQAEIAAMKDRFAVEQQQAAFKREQDQLDREHERYMAEQKFALQAWEAERKAELDRWVAQQNALTERMVAGAQIDLEAERQKHDQRLDELDTRHKQRLGVISAAHAQTMAERKAAQQPQKQTLQ